MKLTTQDEMNKVKEATVKILGQYKNFRIESKIDELEKDFKWALKSFQMNLEMKQSTAKDNWFFFLKLL